MSHSANATISEVKALMKNMWNHENDLLFYPLKEFLGFLHGIVCGYQGL